MDEIKLTEDEFLFLDELLIGVGYKRMLKRQKAKDVIRLNLEAPRPIFGSEVGYFYSNNGYTAKFWSSWLETEKKFRDVSTDAFWSIITHGDELAYTAKPFNRDGIESILNAARYAFVAKAKIDNVPLCPVCKARTAIFRKKNTRQYMWICRKKHPDNKFKFVSWDCGMGPNTKDFLVVRRLATAKYKERCEREGRKPIPAAVLRKKWRIGRPENFIARND